MTTAQFQKKHDSSASPDGHTLSPIINDLLRNGHEFTFSQVMRLARLYYNSVNAKREQPEVPWMDRVRCRPQLSMAFPAADVAGVKMDGGDLLVENTFLKLCDCLPNFYVEDFLDEAANDSSVSRDFVDIFNQPVYQNYYKVWNKGQLFFRIAEEKNPQERERLFSLLGLGQKEIRDSVLDSEAMLRYAGLFMQIRSASGLQALLRDAMGIHCIEIEQCVLRKVPIPVDQQMRFGSNNMRLGINTVLGSYVNDRMGKLTIHIGPLKKKAFDSFLPGTPLYNKLIRLIRLYLIDPFEFDLVLTLAAGEARPIRLGDPNVRLGYDSWCFSGFTLGEVSTRLPLSSVKPEPPPSSGESAYAPERTEPKTLVDYFQEEMALLKDLLARFVQDHPEMAPMVIGHMGDPGIERLMEGAAFINALLRMKLDDDLPEIIHELTEALHPWNLRPIPAMSIVAYKPGSGLVHPLLIRAGAEVASNPVQGTSCRFRTCSDVTVHPLTLLEAAFNQPPGKLPSIRLQCVLNHIPLSVWKPNRLRIFLADDFAAACDLYLLLTRYLKRIILTSPDSGACIYIPPDRLKQVGFGDDETMLAKENSFMPGHLLLQEYFLFHDKYLFLELTGLDKCSNLGDGSRFEVNFELTNCPFAVPKVTAKSFDFSATPVINLFPHKAKAISFISDLKQQAISPATKHPDHFQIYSVDQVEGTLKMKSSKIVYNVQNQLHKRTKDSHPCHISRIKSPIGEGFDTFISIPSHDQKGEDNRIKLDIDLTCTNGVLPEQLNIGDICIATKPAPESVKLGNIKAITPTIFQDNQHNRQWKLLSGFSLNSNTSLNIAENLQTILRLYIPANSRNQISVRADMKRVNSIVSIDTNTTDRLIGRCMYRGYDIKIKLRGDHFAGPGDMYLFSAVLERFMGGYVTQNCFVRLVVEDVENKYRFEWPTRIGDRIVL